MGASADHWLNRPWITRGLPITVAAILAVGGAEVASHGGPTLVKTGDAGPAAEFISAPSTTVPPADVAPFQVPAPTAAPVPAEQAVASVGAVQAVASRPQTPVWRPSHPQADYMGATIASRPNAFIAPGLPTVLQSGTSGVDVSNWQGDINWPAVAAQGVRFAYIKATEATSYTDPQFGSNYAGSASAGLIRGAYHFAVPNVSSGTAQADFFVSHGGGWAPDGRTLPPALDLEYNPYGADPCYGLTPAQMTSWVNDFITAVYQRTDRWPVIYTTTNWWAMCTGNSPQAGAHSRLWLASWTSAGQVRNRPDGWSSYTIWQYADRGAAPGDQDFFHGTYAQLQQLASTSDSSRSPGGPGPAPVTPPPDTLPAAPGLGPRPPSAPIVPTAPTIPPPPAAPRLPPAPSPIISGLTKATSASLLPPG